MMEHFEKHKAPFIPQQAIFNEFNGRNSAKQTNFNLLVDNYQAKNTNNGVNLDYKKFEKILNQDKDRPVFNGTAQLKSTGTASISKRRKHKYPLGDFKFARINELFWANPKIKSRFSNFFNNFDIISIIKGLNT